MSMRSLINLVESCMIDEAGAGPSRVVEHIRQGTPFIMVSASRGDLDAAANDKRTAMLKNKLAGMPVSFIVTGGEYHEVGQEQPSEETSFLIMPKPGVSNEAMVKLGEGLMHAFDQDSIAYGDGSIIHLIFNDGGTAEIGDAASFRPDVVKKAMGFSKIGGRKFTFTMKQDVPTAVGYGSARKAG